MTTKDIAHQSLHILLMLMLLLLLSSASFSQSESKPASVTQIVLLGTGTPGPDPNRSGPATAIVVNGIPYLVDFGPGVVRRASAAFAKGVKGLDVVNIKIAFVTHLHSDHTVGYPDLIFTPWVMGRKVPLEVYGPKGISAMTEHILKAYQADIDVRMRAREQYGRDLPVPGAQKVNAHEIKPGIIYKDQNVTVKAFLVKHELWPEAFGYRFETPDRTIVISGDTSPTQSVIDNCNGCDVLIHEAYTQASFDAVPQGWQAYRLAAHTSSRQLAEIAAKAKPKLLILYHRENPGGGRDAAIAAKATEEQMMKEIREAFARLGYSGKVVNGHDLDIY